MRIEFFFLNLILIFTLFYFSNKIAKIFNLYDRPNKRKIHKNNVPIVGGIIIYFIILLNFFFLKNLDTKILIFASSFFIIGLLDDIFSISPNIRLMILCAVSLIFLIFFENLNIKFLHVEKMGIINLENLSIFFTILCLLLFQNAMNMIDGINGLSGSLFLIFSFFLIFLIGPDQFIYLIILCLIGFLFFNIKNKVFLGDAGIYFLSIIFGIYFIQNSNKFLIYSEEIFLAMLIPGVDMFRLFIIRILNKRNPFKPDKKHLHHLLIKKYTTTQTLFLIVSLVAIPLILSAITNINTFALIIFEIIIYMFFIYKFNGFTTYKT